MFPCYHEFLNQAYQHNGLITSQQINLNQSINSTLSEEDYVEQQSLFFSQNSAYFPRHKLIITFFLLIFTLFFFVLVYCFNLFH